MSNSASPRRFNQPADDPKTRRVNHRGRFKCHGICRGLDAVFGIFTLERVRGTLAEHRQLLRWTVQQRLGLLGVVHPSTATGEHCVRTRRLIARLLYRAAVAACAVPVAAYATIAAAQAISSAVYPPSDWLDRHNSMLRRPVFDAQQALIGFLPKSGDNDLGSKFAVQASVISKACVELVLLQEDRYFTHPVRHWGGVDAVGLLRGVVGIGGGSTLAMQLVRIVDPTIGRLPKLARKVKEIAFARAVVEAFGHDEQALARAYLSVATFGLGHGSLLGITAAADVYFHTRPDLLSPAQCAVLVAQLPRPLPLHRRDEPGVLTAWQANLRRARALLMQSSVPVYRAAAREVDRWTDVIPLRPPIEGAEEGARLNLGVRTTVFVNKDVSRIRAETAPLAPERP